MEIKTHINKNDILNLKSSWQKIYAGTDKNVYLSYEWFKYNIDNINISRPLILVAQEDGRIKAIAAMYEIKTFLKYVFFKIPVTSIQFIANPFATNCDFLVDMDSRNKAIDALIGELHKNKDWDTLALSRIPDDSGNISTLNEILKMQKRFFMVRTSSYCPYINSSLKWEDYYKVQPERFKKTTRNIKNRIDGLDNIKVESIQGGGDPEELFSDILSICKINTRIKSREYLGNDPEKQRLLLNLIKVMQENGWLRAWLLKKGETILAAEIDLFYGNKMHAVFSVYDERYGAYSPGSYLNMHILKHCVDNGFEYDLGPGGEKYKIFWTRTARKTVEFTIFNNKPKTRILFYFYYIKEKIKDISMKERSPFSTQRV